MLKLIYKLTNTIPNGKAGLQTIFAKNAFITQLYLDPLMKI